MTYRPSRDNDPNVPDESKHASLATFAAFRNLQKLHVILTEKSDGVDWAVCLAPELLGELITGCAPGCDHSNM